MDIVYGPKGPSAAAGSDKIEDIYYSKHTSDLILWLASLVNGAIKSA